MGAGDRGRRLAGDVMVVPGADLAALCDRSTAALTRLSPQFPNIPLVSDVSQILEDPTIEAIVIATPVAARYRLATASLAAGKHVFVEHALAGSSREAVDLVEFGDRLDLVVMPGHAALYSSPVGYVTSLIESGQLGEVFSVSITRARLGQHRVDAGVLWDLAPSDLSMLLTWIDERPAVVSAAGRACIYPGKADVVFATLAYPSGRIAHLELSWLSPSTIDRATVVGAHKMVVCDDTADGCVRVVETALEAVESGDPGALRMTVGSGHMLTPRIDSAEPGALQMTDFISAIVHGTTPRSNTRVGVEVVRLIEEVERHLSAGAA